VQSENHSQILVVDDDPEIVSLLEKLLARTGYRVLKAYSGNEAMRIILEQPLDLIILDIILPDINGIWITRRIRQDEKTRMIPIIIITGHREKELRIKGIEAGADDFITKPFDIDEILARVRTSLNLSYYRRELHEKKEFDALIHETVDGVILCSADWTIEEMNASARECLNIQEKGEY